MTQDLSESIDASVRGKLGADSSVSNTIDRAGRVATLIWVSGSIGVIIISAVIAVSLWVSGIRTDVNNSAKLLGEITPSKVSELSRRVDEIERVNRESNLPNRVKELERRGDETDKIFAIRDGRIIALEKYTIQNDVVILSMNALTTANRKDLDSLAERVKKLEPDVQDMVFMRDNGISNRGRFYMKYGYAPAEETGQNPRIKRN
jgi:hypothetical protein